MVWDGWELCGDGTGHCDGAWISVFTLVRPDGERRVRLRIPGEYNIYNALAAASAFYALGTDLDATARGLEAYGGIARRFELCGEIGGVPVIDDYAHIRRRCTSCYLQCGTWAMNASSARFSLTPIRVRRHFMRRLKTRFRWRTLCCWRMFMRRGRTTCTA